MSNETCALLMQHWKFANSTGEAIRQHAAPLESASASVEAVLLNIAGGVALQLENGIPGETLSWRKHPGKFARANIAPEQVEEVLEEVRKGLETLHSAIAGAAF